jgi:hypothetical protein
MRATKLASSHEFTPRIDALRRANALIRDELQARAFVVRTLGKLGLEAEPAKAVGRPVGPQWTGHKRHA